ncbi:MAG: phosphoribosylamine--glycine ligase [Elsteraceae bacterium]
MKVLVVGGGGREHALCWSLAASPLIETLYCAPGNAGIAHEAICVPIKMDDLDGLTAFALEKGVDFVVVGPELPLILGLVDKLEAAGIPAFGPSKAAAQLEGSKAFTKDLAKRAGVPSADYDVFTDSAAALAYLDKVGAPIVIKADGLAAGKGVVVAMTMAEAQAAVRAALEDNRFGDAGAKVVIEEFLEGEEVSFFALVDGVHALPFGSAQDHKRLKDGDQGPNTGGMGAYGPAPIFTAALEAEVMSRFILPTAKALAEAGAPYKGVMYAGLMITKQGPKLIEYNARFGDPECQVLMTRLRSDLLTALLAVRDGQLNSLSVRWRDEPAMTVILAAEGYPETPTKGVPIKGLEEAGLGEGVTLFHCATKETEAGIVSDGGRVLSVTAIGQDLKQARDRAYAAVAKIDYPGSQRRTDIGWRALPAAR